jgi:hypothetical protein
MLTNNLSRSNKFDSVSPSIFHPGTVYKPFVSWITVQVVPMYPVGETDYACLVADTNGFICTSTNLKIATD